MIKVIEKFRTQIRDRKSKDFFGAKTASALNILEGEQRENLEQHFKVNYLMKFIFQNQFLGLLFYCG